MEPFYPPGAFYFSVAVLAPGAGSPAPGVDASFQEVSGIQAELEVEPLAEGGENRFAYRLPRGMKYPNLVLKRGVVPRGSSLVEWMGTTMSSGLATPVTPKNIQVRLLDAKGQPAVAWTFQSAWPVRWELAPMSSLDNKVLVETLELCYTFFDRLNP